MAAMEPYRAAVGATITRYGGRFLTCCGATELIEGGPEPNGCHPRIRRHGRVEALVQFARIPENPAGPGRQLDRPRLHRRRRELGRVRIKQQNAAPTGCSE